MSDEDDLRTQALRRKEAQAAEAGFEVYRWSPEGGYERHLAPS